MIQLVYSPQWFYGRDIVIDVISSLVLLLISFFSLKYYLVNKKKTYLGLSMSFLTIALSFIFKIMINFEVYYAEIESKTFAGATILFKEIGTLSMSVFTGLFLHRFLMLLGLYMLFTLYYKQSKENHLIMIFLLIITTYFAVSAYYLFRLMSFLFLLYITLFYFKNNYCNKNKNKKESKVNQVDNLIKNKLIESKSLNKNFKLVKKKSKNSNNNFNNILLAQSFLIITISQLVFVFIIFNPLIYVVAEITQLIGFLGLLTTFLMVFRNGK